MMLEA